MFDNCELNIQRKDYHLLRIYTNHCCKQLLNVAPSPYYIAIVNYLMFLICRYMYKTFVHINHCKFSIIRYCNLTKFHIPVFLPTYKWNENHQNVQIRCKSVLNNNKYPVLTHNGDSKTAPHQVYQSRLPGSAVSEILPVSCLRGFHQGPLSSSWFGTFPSMVYLPCAASSLIVVPWWCCLYL